MSGSSVFLLSSTKLPRSRAWEGLLVKATYWGPVLRKRELKEVGWCRERKLKKSVVLAGD